MKRFMKHIISYLLVLAMVLVTLPASSLAIEAEAETTADATAKLSIYEGRQTGFLDGKAIYLQTPEHTIRVVGIKPIRNLSVGDSLTLYVADNTAVYSMEGCSVICSYIAMIKTLPTQKKEIQTQ